MILSTNTQSLQLILAGAVGATEPSFVVGYRQLNQQNKESININRGVTTSGTAVTLVAAPEAGIQREIKFLAIHNRDNASVTLTIRINDNGTFYDIYKATLATLENLIYTEGAGFIAYTTGGAMK